MKKIYLIGNPLGHSWSPEIHSRLASYTYELKQLSRDELEDFIVSGEYDGLNVTIPYKRDVIPYLDEISPEAARIGSVNTVVRRNGKLYGTNTDYLGFSYMLEDSGIAVKGKKVLVLGSGGSSATVRTVLADMGALEVVVISRSGENNYANLSRHYDADVIVNTTPVGMYPMCGDAPLDLSAFPSLSGVVDLIYNPDKTALILDAEERNIPYVSGLTLLVAQAKRSAEIFTGETMADEVIASTIRSLKKEKKNIILVGMPGCGKTSVGTALASLTGRKFVDTDELITEKYGRTPEEIILSDGEERFRDFESEVLGSVTKESSLVISCGGGTVIRKKNRRMMRQNGVVVLIKRDIGSLNDEHRPLSLGRGNDVLWAERKCYYESAADIEVDNSSSPDKTASLIAERLESL